MRRLLIFFIFNFIFIFFFCINLKRQWNVKFKIINVFVFVVNFLQFSSYAQVLYKNEFIVVFRDDFLVIYLYCGDLVYVVGEGGYWVIGFGVINSYFEIININQYLEQILKEGNVLNKLIIVVIFFQFQKSVYDYLVCGIYFLFILLVIKLLMGLDFKFMQEIFFVCSYKFCSFLFDCILYNLI